jgi:hypothetical protein
MIKLGRVVKLAKNDFPLTESATNQLELSRPTSRAFDALIRGAIWNTYLFRTQLYRDLSALENESASQNRRSL